MTSVIASGAFNALASAGAGYLFELLGNSGYKDEIRRHNKAMGNFLLQKTSGERTRLLKRIRLCKKD